MKNIRWNRWRWSLKWLHFLYPTTCPGCNCVVEWEKDGWKLGDGFCLDCRSKVEYALEPLCKICGKRLSDDRAEICSDCRRRGHAFHQGRGVYIYSGAMHLSMYRFKYSNRRSYSEVYVLDTLRLLGPWLHSLSVDAVVPIPMYGPKERRRGYNQARVFAEALGRELGIAVLPDLVIRTRDTKPMKGLSKSSRQSNLKNAFNITTTDVKFNKILLVDDIYTTGATLDAVAQVLKQAGVADVYGLYLCVGQGD